MALPAHAPALSINYLPRLMPPTRKLFILERGSLVISDTVDSIHELPHTLVVAFRANNASQHVAASSGFRQPQSE